MDADSVSGKLLRMSHGAEPFPASNREFSVGQQITVLAWWAKRAPVKCEIRELWSKFDNLLTVQPLEGNPHLRNVDIKDVVRN
jgi:hypothetical protein